MGIRSVICFSARVPASFLDLELAHDLGHSPSCFVGFVTMDIVSVALLTSSLSYPSHSARFLSCSSEHFPTRLACFPRQDELPSSCSLFLIACSQTLLVYDYYAGTTFIFNSSCLTQTRLYLPAKAMASTLLQYFSTLSLPHFLTYLRTP